MKSITKMSAETEYVNEFKRFMAGLLGHVGVNLDRANRERILTEAVQEAKGLSVQVLNQKIMALSIISHNLEQNTDIKDARKQFVRMLEEKNFFNDEGLMEVALTGQGSSESVKKLRGLWAGFLVDYHKQLDRAWSKSMKFLEWNEKHVFSSYKESVLNLTKEA